MVAIHAGTEYLHAPNEQQLQVFADLTASPYVDFVYGHHAHVVQPFDRVNGKWVLYGLGNMVAQQEPERRDTFRGIVARLTLTERPDGGFSVEDPRYAPTLILNPTTTGATRVLDVARVRRSPTAPPVAAPPGPPGGPVDRRGDGATRGAPPDGRRVVTSGRPWRGASSAR